MYSQIGEECDAQRQGYKSDVVLRQQNGHGEELFLIQCIEHKDCVDNTGKHVDGEADEHGQHGQCVAQQQAQNTQSDRQ